MSMEYNNIELPEKVREWINRQPGYHGINIRENAFTNQERWLLGRTSAQIWEYAKSHPLWTCPLFKRTKLTECTLTCEEKCGSHECWEVFSKWAVTIDREIDGMESVQADSKCGDRCRCWHRCNYCRFSGVMESKENNYPAFFCKNEEYPMCHAGDGFECIFRNIPESCPGKRKRKGEPEITLQDSATKNEEAGS